MTCLISENELTPNCYKTIMSTIAEAVVITDGKGNIKYSNNALTVISGYSMDELAKISCDSFVEYKNGSIIDDVMKNGKSDLIECNIIKKDHTKVPVLINGQVLKEETNDFVFTVVDMGSLKKSDRRFTITNDDNYSGRFNIIGNSKEIRNIHEQIILASSSRATVLVTGETGTGKELVAKAIHQNSDLSNGPFVAVNCSALPENLLESELFGHSRGAFTGAVKDKIGRFELADGGTLFLDEIGEISPLIQVKLLRFLQEKEFERVGESITRKSDVRIIAATNKNLWKMSREGGFREDLFYRLKVFPIHIPPLRARKQDIRLLIKHFIDKFNNETEKDLKGLSHDAGLTLMDYCWPGNIRELENAIEHAFVTCREGEIGLFDLPVEIRQAEIRSDICSTAEKDISSAYVSAPTTVTNYNIAENDRDRLIKLLGENNWNRSKVAELLGIDRTTVWRKMKKYGIG